MCKQEPKLKILKVIHGFPPYFMAGSEVYSQTLCKEFVKLGHSVSIFTRVENEFDEYYKVYDEKYENKYSIRRINKPKDYLYRDKFYDKDIELAFKHYLDEVKPDIVHFGHLAHLSINLVRIAKTHKKPVIFTLHDFWLYCVKGQLIDSNNKQCEGPDVLRCKNCSPYKPAKHEVKKILDNLQEIRDSVDMFISPSHTLRNYFINKGVKSEKIIYQKYGFDKQRITYKKRYYDAQATIKFAYMGRIIPTKGITILLEAFKQLWGNYQGQMQKLRIYGEIGKNKKFLEHDAIEFKGGYDNDSIDKILQDIDVLIVPSIWLENSPLVIQEAFLAGVPVVSANIGGMQELIEKGCGLSFEARNKKSLEKVLEKIILNPTILNDIPDNRHNVDSIQQDCEKILSIYNNILKEQ